MAGKSTSTMQSTPVAKPRTFKALPKKSSVNAPAKRSSSKSKPGILSSVIDSVSEVAAGLVKPVRAGTKAAAGACLHEVAASVTGETKAVAGAKKPSSAVGKKIASTKTGKSPAASPSKTKPAGTTKKQVSSTKSKVKN